MKAQTEDKVMDEQGGFKAGRGCVNHVFVVRQVVKKKPSRQARRHTWHL